VNRPDSILFCLIAGRIAEGDDSGAGEARSVVQSIRSLRELSSKGGHIHCECACRRVAKFSVGDLAAYLMRKGLTDAWPQFARHLRCGGCGARSPKVSWYVSPPPPEDDPPPPRPRSVRNALPVPRGVDMTEWERAADDRERRRLVRRARG